MAPSFQAELLHSFLRSMILGTQQLVLTMLRLMERLRELYRQPILKQTDPFLALMSYRATPLQATGVSPSQLMIGRQICTTVPTLESKLQPEWPDLQQVRQTDATAKQNRTESMPMITGMMSDPCQNLSLEIVLLLSWTMNVDGQRRLKSSNNVTLQGHIWSRQTEVCCAGTVATYSPSCLLQRLQ